MSLTKATLFQRVRDVLLDTPYATPFTANLASTTTTTVAVADGTLWDAASVGEWEDNGEQFYVRSVSSNNLTVFRGWNGTTATTHDGSGTAIAIFKNPAFSYKRIQDRCDAVITGLWPYAWKKATLTLTPLTTTDFYNLASDFIDPIQVSQLSTGSPQDVYLYGGNNLGATSSSGPIFGPPAFNARILPVSYMLNLPTSLVASGAGMSFPQGVFNYTNTIQVDYRATLTTTGTTSYTDLSDGLLAEVIQYGAAASLVGMTEAPRVTNQAVSMGDSSVQPGGRARAGAILQGDFIRLRKAYYEYLWKTIPPMGTWRR